ncbi:hypothetical protein BDV40DRAFT_149208 [Aspergillus tamarii]|uniref:Uncharacterized protein n=1 Tax=Aspergillus tamarii TaxID=41984 RepID=A0A5N6UWG9_ASPTM|nr:hypothetical protein BDV40DRAFT_149208 [Aspergillus tamarii]
MTDDVTNPSSDPSGIFRFFNLSSSGIYALCAHHWMLIHTKIGKGFPYVFIIQAKLPWLAVSQTEHRLSHRALP